MSFLKSTSLEQKNRHPWNHRLLIGLYCDSLWKITKSGLYDY